VRPEAGLGDDGQRLHDWGLHNPSARNHEIVTGWERAGATIFGRTTYDLAIPHWGADGPTGPVRIPVVVVSHSVPEDIPEGGVYHFASGVEDASRKAQALAGEKDIAISGSDVARQFLELGLIDELWIHIVPVLFGSGTPLFGHLVAHITLEPTEVVETPEVIHLRFRVVR
jgi:dihydrofolate reductase